MRVITVLTSLGLLVSCTAHKLEVRLNGQPTTSMEGRVDKENGTRMVDLLIPGGRWAVSATEPGIHPRLVEVDGRQHVRIELPPDRMISLKPIVITLQGLDASGLPAGSPYTVSLDYSSHQQKASRYS